MLAVTGAGMPNWCQTAHTVIASNWDIVFSKKEEETGDKGNYIMCPDFFSWTDIVNVQTTEDETGERRDDCKIFVINPQRKSNLENTSVDGMIMQ